MRICVEVRLTELGPAHVFVPGPFDGTTLCGLSATGMAMGWDHRGGVLDRDDTADGRSGARVTCEDCRSELAAKILRHLV